MVGWVAMIVVVVLPASDVWQRTHSEIWFLLALVATAVALALANPLVRWMLDSVPEPAVWRGRPIPWDASEFVPGALVDELLDDDWPVVLVFALLTALPFALFLWPVRNLPLLGLDTWFARIAPERGVFLAQVVATAGWATVASVAFWNAFNNLRAALLELANKSWRLAHPHGSIR
jgi:hypothetical protein